MPEADDPEAFENIVTKNINIIPGSVNCIFSNILPFEIYPLSVYTKNSNVFVVFSFS